MLETEYKFFIENLAALKEQYKKPYILVVGTEICGNYDKYEEAFKSALEKYEYGKFLIQNLFEDQNPPIRFCSRVYA